MSTSSVGFCCADSLSIKIAQGKEVGGGGGYYVLDVATSVHASVLFGTSSANGYYVHVRGLSKSQSRRGV